MASCNSLPAANLTRLPAGIGIFCPRVDALTGRRFLHGEPTKPNELDLITVVQCVAHSFVERVEVGLCLFLSAAGLLTQAFDAVRFTKWLCVKWYNQREERRCPCLA
jgi:hypothetical protein